MTNPPPDDHFIMTRADLERLREMRALQRRFFAGDKFVFSRAKHLEREVDKWLDSFPPDDEPNLFRG